MEVNSDFKVRLRIRMDLKARDMMQGNSLNG